MGYMTNRPNVLPRWAYLFTQFTVLLTYLRLLVLPVNQSILHDYPVAVSFFEPRVMLSFLFLLMLFLLGFYLFLLSRIKKRELRLIAFGIFWFFIAHLVESSIIPLTITIQEHRMYLPSIGIFMALSGVFFLIVRNVKSYQHIFVSVAIIISIIFSAVTYKRNIVWRSKQSFWGDVIKKAPDNPVGYSNLGAALLEQGMIDEAMKYLEKAGKIGPVSISSQYNLGQIYMKKGLYEKALLHFNLALRLQPNNFRLHYGLGRCYRELGHIEKALKHIEYSLRLNPFGQTPMIK